MEGYSTNVGHFSRNYGFQNFGTGLRQSKFVFNISESIVIAAEVKWPFRFPDDWSFKLLNINCNLSVNSLLRPSHTGNSATVVAI